jgi:predicted nucleic acid-binding protein
MGVYMGNADVAVDIEGRPGHLLGFTHDSQRLLSVISGGPLLINEINVGETYYILSRRRGVKSAEYFLDTILAGLPVKIVPHDFNHVIAAARIKAQHPLSFADSFAVATAMSEGAAVMTGDPEL